MMMTTINWISTQTHSFSFLLAITRRKTMNSLSILLLSLLLLAALPNAISAGTSLKSTPQLQPGFRPTPTNVQLVETGKSCSYTVTIKTSCSSPAHTRDQISLAFGDSYGNEVYAKRLDDPYYGTFERCSKDTFKITGPCVREVCYLYLLRKGSDGWKPESVKVYGQYIRTESFDYGVFLPNGVWYGVNLCNSASGAGDESLSAIM